MPLPEAAVLQCLMRWRTRISAAVWLVARDVHAGEDIFQNMVLKAMTRDVSFEEEGALISWAFITARREAIDWLRKEQRGAVRLDEKILSLLEVEWTLQHREPASKMAALKECLEGVSTEARKLLRLRYFDGFSCEEAARQLGLSLDAVYKRISRLHQGLRKCIEGKLQEGNAKA